MSIGLKSQWVTLCLCICTGVLGGCGGSGGSDGSLTPNNAANVGTTVTAAVAPPANPLLSLSPCLASGAPGAVDYQVGPGKPYTAIDQVPWENLRPGDTVRIFYTTTPYKGKIAITTTGTLSAPIRVCGVRGPSNERPIIDGAGAITRTTIHYRNQFSSIALYRHIYEDRSIVLIKNDYTSPTAWTDYPAYIQIDGLQITRAYPSYSYTDSFGAVRNYVGFGACVWIDRGHHITIADNEINDCTQAIYTKSTDDGDFAVTRDVRIAGNYMWGNGYTGDATDGADRLHTTYTASKDIIIEFNRYGPLRSGGMGNSIKDRSIGTTIRYNRIEEGAHALDLVEAEDFYVTALADPGYRTTLVYGNQIVKNGDTGSVIHYGGDHPGPGITYTTANYGERIFRKGTLYFFNNSLHITGTAGAQLFQISTTEETVEAWNNVFNFHSSLPSGFRALRAVQGVASGYTSGGVLNLGVNWMTTGWGDSDIYHPITGGAVNGTSNILTGITAPFDTSTLFPLPGSAIIDTGQANVSAASGVAVSYQLGTAYQGITRTINGAHIDLGAVER